LWPIDRSAQIAIVTSIVGVRSLRRATQGDNRQMFAAGVELDIQLQPLASAAVAGRRPLIDAYARSCSAISSGLSAEEAIQRDRRRFNGTGLIVLHEI
jgi:hypothetical protein